MESLPQDNMIERLSVQQQLEAPYITAIKGLVHERIPDHEQSFTTFFDYINRELLRKAEGKDKGGLFVWESKKYPGVRFLAGHIRITDEVVRAIASDLISTDESKSQEISSPNEKEQRRVKHIARFLQPAFGFAKDGSGLSVLDMAFSPALDIATSIAASIRRGEEPVTGEIFLFGTPKALGGQTTMEFNQAVSRSRVQGRGLDPFGEINAEFIEEHVSQSPQDLASTKIVVEGISKGAATAQRTISHLSKEIRERTQLLYYNPAATHGKYEEDVEVNRTKLRRLKNLPTQIGRSANLIGFVGEVGIRMVTSSFGKTLNKVQPQFYLDIAKVLGIPDDTNEQKKLKKQLRNAELATLIHGAPLDKSIKSYEKVSSPDTANTGFKVIKRVLSVQKGTPLFYKDGETLVFPNKNKTHMWPWMRSIDTGSWKRKIKFIENTRPQKAA